MSPLFIQHYIHSGLPKIRQMWRASRLKFVFNRSLVDDALLWLADKPDFFTAPSTEDFPTDGSDLLPWLSKRASSIGVARALEKSASANNSTMLRCLVQRLDPKMDLSDMVSLGAQTQNWESVSVLHVFSRPVPHNTALISAVRYGQVGLIPALVPTSSPSVINKALSLAAQTKQPSAVVLLINHCAEWARTDALGQALLNDCVDSVHMLAPLSDCLLVKDWANTALKSGWEDQASAVVLNQYTPRSPKI